MKKPTDFAYHLTNFLTTHMVGRRGLSINTVRSYRDTFKLFLQYCADSRSLSTGRLTLSLVDRDLVSGFMTYLEEKRNAGNSTLNQRLAAVHAFVKYLQIEEPTYILEYQRILSIPYRRALKPVIEYLSKDALRIYFASIDTATRRGRRDYCLLTVLYDTGARVQELCDLRIRDLILDDNPYVRLAGKGSKTQLVPLLDSTVKLLRRYMEEFHASNPLGNDAFVFFGKGGDRLSRSTVNHMIDKYAKISREKSPLIPEKVTPHTFQVTPHTFRHTKAMHLCQAGVDMIYIRDILGHVSLETTNIYAKINIEQMRDALENTYPELSGTDLPDWSEDNSLMDFLTGL